LKSNPIVV